MLFAYFGPETVLPLTSTAAMIAGFLLMFGRQTRGLCRFAVRKVFRRNGNSSKPLILRSAGKRYRKDGAETRKSPRVGRAAVAASQVES